MSLEDRVRNLEDRVALNDLIVRYFLAADGDDLQGVGDSFTATATFSSSGAIAAEGRGNIVEFIRTSREHMGLTLHTPHYAQLAFEATDQAAGLVGAHLELVLGGTALYGAVRYVDTYRRTEDGWQIQSRDMRVIYVAPWSQAGDALESLTPVRWPGAAPAPTDFPRGL